MQDRIASVAVLYLDIEKYSCVVIIYHLLVLVQLVRQHLAKCCFFIHAPLFIFVMVFIFTDVLMVHILLLVYFLFRQEFLSLGYKSTRKLYIHANNLYSACYTTYRWLSVAYRLFFIVMQSKCLVIHSLVYAKRSVIPYAIE